MNQIKNALVKEGHQCKVFYFRKKQNDNVYLGNNFLLLLNVIHSRFCDRDGFVLFDGAKKLIDELNNFNPDIVHIHCLHGYYMNSLVLFDYFKKNGIKVVWTMHDNWAFTGHCAYFDLRKCEKWKTQCDKCPSKSDYPSTLFEKSKRNYVLKKEVFTSLDQKMLYIVSPSKWLDKQIEDSFLNKYNHFVIYNSINLEKFKDYGFKREKILLAVASVWDYRKNLNRVLEISNNLKEWKVIVIGKIKKKIKRNKYPNVTFMDRTDSVDELVNLYNKASILLNPTLADNFPTVNLEAQKCGLRVLSYDVGGTKETNMGSLYFFDNNTLVDDMYLDYILTLDKTHFEFMNLKMTMENEYIKLFKKILENER